MHAGGLPGRRRDEPVGRRARAVRRSDAASDSRTYARGVRAAGGELAGVYYCPHGPDERCECRKPRPGLFRRLERELGICGRRRTVHRRQAAATSSCSWRSAPGRFWCVTGTGTATVARPRRSRRRSVRRSCAPRRQRCSGSGDERGAAVARLDRLHAVFVRCRCPCTGCSRVRDPHCYRGASTDARVWAGRTRCCAAAALAVQARLRRGGTRALAGASIHRADEALLGLGDARAAADFSAADLGAEARADVDPDVRLGASACCSRSRSIEKAAAPPCNKSSARKVERSLTDSGCDLPGGYARAGGQTRRYGISGALLASATGRRSCPSRTMRANFGRAGAGSSGRARFAW